MIHAVKRMQDRCETALGLFSGYAFSGGGQKIVRVDITADGGKSWHVAKLTDQDSANPPRNWAWSLWSADIPVDAKDNKVSWH